MRYEWYATVSDGATTTTSAIRTFNTAPGADPVIVGAGDVQTDCSGNGDDDLTGEMVKGIQGSVFTLGDNTQNGTVNEYDVCYESTWGGATKARTRPAPGNHDWVPGNLNNYFTYFGAQAGGTPSAPWYSYNVGSFWHVIVLDSDCTLVAGGCAAGSPQHQFLVNDLAANSSRNVIATWHHPRYSSGATNMTALQPFVDALYAARADLILVGHDHLYERQTLMNATGNADPTNGIRFITSGTGGGSHHSFGDHPADQPGARPEHVRPAAARAAPDELRLRVPAGRRARLHGFGQHVDRRQQHRADARPCSSRPAARRRAPCSRPSRRRTTPMPTLVSLTWEWRVNGTLRRTFTSTSALTRHVRPRPARQRRRGRQHQRHRHAGGRHAHRHAPRARRLIVSETNAAPVFSTDLADFSVSEGGVVDLHPAATDADDDPLDLRRQRAARTASRSTPRPASSAARSTRARRGCTTSP